MIDDVNRLVAQWRGRERSAVKELRGLKKKTVFITTAKVEAHLKTGPHDYMKTVQLPIGTEMVVTSPPEMNEGGLYEILTKDIHSEKEYLIDLIELDGRAMLP